MYSFWLVTNVFGLLLAAGVAIFVNNKVTVTLDITIMTTYSVFSDFDKSTLVKRIQ